MDLWPSAWTYAISCRWACWYQAPSLTCSACPTRRTSTRCPTSSSYRLFFRRTNRRWRRRRWSKPDDFDFIMESCYFHLSFWNKISFVSDYFSRTFIVEREAYFFCSSVFKRERLIAPSTFLVFWIALNRYVRCLKMNPYFVLDHRRLQVSLNRPDGPASSRPWEIGLARANEVGLLFGFNNQRSLTERRCYGTGLLFGIWNSHTSVGNILGSLIAGHYVEDDWGMSFILPGAIIGVMGFVIFLFLVTDPRSVGCSPPDHHGRPEVSAVIYWCSMFISISISFKDAFTILYLVITRRIYIVEVQ